MAKFPSRLSLGLVISVVIPVPAKLDTRYCIFFRCSLVEIFERCLLMVKHYKLVIRHKTQNLDMVHRVNDNNLERF